MGEGRPGNDQDKAGPSYNVIKALTWQRLGQAVARSHVRRGGGRCSAAASEAADLQHRRSGLSNSSGFIPHLNIVFGD